MSISPSDQRTPLNQNTITYCPIERSKEEKLFTKKKSIYQFLKIF